MGEPKVDKFASQRNSGPSLGNEPSYELGSGEKGIVPPAIDPQRLKPSNLDEFTQEFDNRLFPSLKFVNNKQVELLLRSVHTAYKGKPRFIQSCAAALALHCLNRGSKKSLDPQKVISFCKENSKNPSTSSWSYDPKKLEQLIEKLGNIYRIRLQNPFYAAGTTHLSEKQKEEALKAIEEKVVKFQKELRRAFLNHLAILENKDPKICSELEVDDELEEKPPDTVPEPELDFSNWNPEDVDISEEDVSRSVLPIAIPAVIRDYLQTHGLTAELYRGQGGGHFLIVKGVAKVSPSLIAVGLKAGIQILPEQNAMAKAVVAKQDSLRTIGASRTGAPNPPIPTRAANQSTATGMEPAATVREGAGTGSDEEVSASFPPPNASQGPQTASGVAAPVLGGAPAAVGNSAPAVVR